MGWSRYLSVLGSLGISAQELPRVDPNGLLWTGWSEWYGCAGQTFYEPSELCAFPERRKLKSYRYKLCVQPDDLNYPEANPAVNIFDENQPQKMFKADFEKLGLTADSDMETYKNKDFTNVKPAYGHESTGLTNVSLKSSLTVM